MFRMDMIYQIATSVSANVKYVYNNMNSATLSGAIDIIVVEQPDNTLMSTPFHIRFGKYSVFNSDEKYVDVTINGETTDLKMKLAENGVAYFVQETESTDVPEILASTIEKTKPIKKALEKEAASEAEMLAGTDENSAEPQTRIGQEVKLRQESGNYTSDGSDEEPILIDRTRNIRSLRLSSDELKSLKLKYGGNEAKFSITTKFQGTSWCQCYIYLYKYSDKLVISDIDGTITKSDVLGHVIPAIGGQWAHTGVAHLYTKIKQNGYKIVYLSSRAIGQSSSTKAYLSSLVQDSQKLPDGPVLLNPTSVLMAFRKEVIERKPEEFKIACLSDLRKLFPVKKPFYAGFGNRDTDVKSYLAVDVPPERILIIDPSGAVKRADSIGFETIYASMANDIVDYLFPPLHAAKRRPSNDHKEIIKTEKMVTNFTKPETCSTFTHWRTAPEALDDDLLANYENKRKQMEEQNKKNLKKRNKKQNV